ncbi:unnamed protein product [Linum trigynum]|uniref:Uncharacterized protein n=1 Tax=Linum trigynum TaxID=586398 RepID=A0AAV2FS07_9ROSI
MVLFPSLANATSHTSDFHPTWRDRGDSIKELKADRRAITIPADAPSSLNVEFYRSNDGVRKLKKDAVLFAHHMQAEKIAKWFDEVLGLKYGKRARKVTSACGGPWTEKLNMDVNMRMNNLNYKVDSMDMEHAWSFVQLRRISHEHLALNPFSIIIVSWFRTHLDNYQEANIG